MPQPSIEFQKIQSDTNKKKHEIKFNKTCFINYTA